MFELALIVIACLILVAYWLWQQAAHEWRLQAYEVRIHNVRQDHQDVMSEALPARRAFELTFVTRDRSRPAVADAEGRAPLPARQAFELAFVHPRQSDVAAAGTYSASPAQVPAELAGN